MVTREDGSRAFRPWRMAALPSAQEFAYVLQPAKRTRRQFVRRGSVSRRLGRAGVRSGQIREGVGQRFQTGMGVGGYRDGDFFSMSIFA